MKTKIITIDEKHIEADAIGEAGEILKRGGLVAFPTETVYGLGGDALNENSSARIYAAKGRPSDNPLIVHIAHFEALHAIVKKVPDAAYLLAKRFWPGPLTMIFEKSEVVPLKTTGGLSTVAVRMPSHPTARALIEAAGGYVAAPSANRSGRPSPTLARYVTEDLEGRVDMIIDGGESVIGLESTIVDLTEDIPVILRPGYITSKMLAEVLGEVRMDETLFEVSSDTAPKAPGMKYRHYAPRGSLTIVEGEPEAVVKYINQAVEAAVSEGKRAGVIATDDTAGRYRNAQIKSMGVSTDEESAAKLLFRILREFDEEDIQVMFAQSVPRLGIGQAVMNRLLKAAGHQVIYLNKEKGEDADEDSAWQ